MTATSNDWSGPKRFNKCLKPPANPETEQGDGNWVSLNESVSVSTLRQQSAGSARNAKLANTAPRCEMFQIGHKSLQPAADFS